MGGLKKTKRFLSIYLKIGKHVFAHDEKNPKLLNWIDYWIRIHWTNFTFFVLIVLESFTPLSRQLLIQAGPPKKHLSGSKVVNSAPIFCGS